MKSPHECMAYSRELLTHDKRSPATVYDKHTTTYATISGKILAHEDYLDAVYD